MSRRRSPDKREQAPDPRFGDVMVTKFINYTMKDGKKSTKDEFHLSRVRRVARGSGRKEDEVRELINKFATMKTMMLQLGSQAGLLGKIPGLKQLQQMKNIAGLDMEKLEKQIHLAAGEEDRARLTREARAAAAPGRIQSAFTIRGLPVAATIRSAPRQMPGRSRVRE